MSDFKEFGSELSEVPATPELAAEQAKLELGINNDCSKQACGTHCSC